MKNHYFFAILTRFLTLALVAVLTGCGALQPNSTQQGALEAQARQALRHLLLENPAALKVAHQSLAVLVFPSIIKGGFVYGGQSGNGVLFRRGMPAGYYNTSAFSYGLQAGLQDYGYALFFMTEDSLSYLNKSKGFELGVGPSVVVADAGFAKNYTTSTLTQDIYAFVFNQRGLMAGMGITGSKITHLSP